MLVQKTVTDLLDAFASPDPTPGGGSAAALAGAMGASLLAMVAGLPKTKSGAHEERTALDRARTELLHARQQLLDLVDRDAAAYDLVVAAFRLPKATDDEKTARTNAIQHAMKTATDVPIETMRACERVMAAAVAVSEYGNPSAQSDLAVAVQLLSTANTGALFNVQVNIGSVKDAAYVERTTAEVRRISAAWQKHSRPIFESGLIDLMKKSAQLTGATHGTPPAGDQLVKSLAELLRHIGTPDTRRALEVLAQSTAPDMRAAATQALEKFPR